MYTIETHIGLKDAEEFLTKNRAFVKTDGVSNEFVKNTNRPVSINHVSYLAWMMLRGRWRKTHQGIAFDKDGYLIDGQHRLMALVKACTDGVYGQAPNNNLTIPVTIFYETDSESFVVLDNGRPRNATDILSMGSEANAVRLASALKYLYLYYNFDNTVWLKIRVSNDTIQETLERHPEIRDATRSASKIIHLGMSPSAAAVGIYVCSKEYPDGDMTLFLDGIQHGIELKRTDPRLALRNTIIRNRTNYSGKQRRYAYRNDLACFIKCWNDFIQGKERIDVRLNKNEPFPIPYKPKNK